MLQCVSFRFTQNIETVQKGKMQSLNPNLKHSCSKLPVFVVKKVGKKEWQNGSKFVGMLSASYEMFSTF